MIDSHQHFWKVGRFDYPWMSPTMTLLYRDYLPDDLRPLLASAGVDKTIIVQASPSVAETGWLLKLAAENDFVAGAVGWLDLEAPDFAEQLTRYRRNPLLVGLRPAVEFIDDVAWLLRPRVTASLQIMADAGVPLDLIIWPRHLPAVIGLLQRVPKLRCVVDHLAKPDVKNREMESWKAQMAQVARHPNICCKLSGLMTMADHAQWKPRDLQPYFDHVLDIFGVDRLMYGSDWPVSLLVSDYATTVRVVRDAVAHRINESGMKQIFNDNAAAFYNLKLAVSSTR